MDNLLNKKDDSGAELKGLALLLTGTFTLIIFLLFLLAVTPPSALLSGAGKERGLLTLNTEEIFPLEEGEAGNYYPYNSDHLIKVTNNLLSYVSFKGKEESSYEISCRKPQVRINQKYILVADDGGFNYYLFNQAGLVLEGKTDAPIRGMSVSASGKTAFIMDELNTKGVLRVLDENGKHILDWRIRDRLRSGYVISMSFTADSQFIDVSQVNTDGAGLQSMMTRLDLNKAEINLSVVQPGNGIYPLIYSLPDKSVLLVNGKNILKNDGGEVRQWLSFHQIYETAVSDEGIGLIAADYLELEPKFYYFTFKDQGNFGSHEHVLSLDVGREPHAPAMAFGKISVADGEGVYVLKESNIRDANFFAAGSEVLRQQFISENHLLLICRSSVQIIRV